MFPDFFDILHAILYILVLFGFVCLGQQYQPEGRKDTPPVFFLLGDDCLLPRDRQLWVQWRFSEKYFWGLAPHHLGGNNDYAKLL